MIVLLITAKHAAPRIDVIDQIAKSKEMRQSEFFVKGRGRGKVRSGQQRAARRRRAAARRRRRAALGRRRAARRRHIAAGRRRSQVI